MPQDRRRLIAAPACVVRRLEQTAARATAQRLKRGRAEVTPEDAFRDAGIVLPPGAMLQVRWSARVKSARVKSAAKERQCLVPRAWVILSCASSRAQLSRARASLSCARASVSTFDGSRSRARQLGTDNTPCKGHGAVGFRKIEPGEFARPLNAPSYTVTGKSLKVRRRWPTPPSLAPSSSSLAVALPL